MDGFLIFIAIVFGILQLILFFKIWGMTNNVWKIKSDIEKWRVESETPPPALALERVNSPEGSVTVGQLGNEIIRQKVLDNLSQNILPSDQGQWNAILSSADYKIATKLLPLYAHYKTTNEFVPIPGKLLIENYSNLIRRLEEEKIADFLYGSIGKVDSTPLINLLKEVKMFSQRNILELLENGKIREGIKFLSIEKDYYTRGDLSGMNEILLKLDSLPDGGRIEMVKGTLSSKMKEKYICPRGHKNDTNSPFCQSCGENIKGLDYGEVERIDKFKMQVKSLEYLFEKQNIYP